MHNFILILMVLGSICTSSSLHAVESTAETSQPTADQALPPAPSTEPVAAPSSTGDSTTPDQKPTPKTKPVEEDAEPDNTPWDYQPYRVLVWIVSQDPAVNAESIRPSLLDFVDRDFAAAWRVTIDDAPETLRSAALRNLDKLSYDTITAADPVLAIKRGHKDAVRIRIAANVAEFVKKIYATEAATAQLSARGGEAVAGVVDRIEALPGDAYSVRERWVDEGTEAVLVTRGIATTLTKPKAKLINLQIDDLITETIENYDKIFFVRVSHENAIGSVDVVEMDTLIRYFGPVASVPLVAGASIADTIGHGLVKAFSPMVRIDEAGQKTADGLLRAGGLVLDKDSPAMLRVGDVLQPMTRKNDRNGNPFQIGALDWSYLLVKEMKDRTAKMDYYAGRSGGLQGRKNSRTHRVALKIKPWEDQTTLRLHLQGNPNFPLIGYEIYERELDSKEMTFIGRTDWDGRLPIGQTKNPMRLFYVKNGGAVLARLPMVPGFQPLAVADLQGDDMRLEAEAYIRGVQNSIIDLVAVRELFKARIRMRLQAGEMEKAEELMEALRNQPSNEKLNKSMGKKHTVFLKQLGIRNNNQRVKVDQMFTTTRALLTKHINPKLVRDLESDMITATQNGGKLPPDPEPEEETTE